MVRPVYREKPDWDLYVAAILAYGMQQAGSDVTAEEILTIQRLAEERFSPEERAKKKAEHEKRLAPLNQQWEEERYRERVQRAQRARQIARELHYVLGEVQKQKAAKAQEN